MFHLIPLIPLGLMVAIALVLALYNKYAERRRGVRTPNHMGVFGVLGAVTVVALEVVTRATGSRSRPTGTLGFSYLLSIFA